MTNTRIKLSTNFWLHEFLRSQTAARMGRVIEADELIIADIRRLCVEVLEPIRSHFDGKAITITSGYRPLWLNQRIGGSSKSEHLYGRAADFVVHGFTPLQVCRGITTLMAQLPVNQVIFEFGEWTHISICAEGEPPRRQVLTAQYVESRLCYSAGLPIEQRAVA